MEWEPKCPRCAVTLTVQPGYGQGSTRDEDIIATHICDKCKRPIKVTPPDNFQLERLKKIYDSNR
jgi:hypothetical protein